MTTPLVAAAPAPAPSPSPAATDAPGGAERFASALDDAVARGQGGPPGRERAVETEDTAAEPVAETPDGEPPVTGPPVAGAGMPPGLWALLTGIGPGAPGPATAVARAADSAVAAVAAAGPAAAVAAAVAGPVVAPPAVPDVVPTAPPPAGVPAPAPPGVLPVPGAPAADAVPFGTPVPAPATAATAAPAATDLLPGLTVVLAGAEVPVTPTAPALETPEDVVPLPQPAATPAAAAAADAGTGTGTGTAPDQDAPSPAAAPAPAPASAPASASASAPGSVAAVAAPAIPAATPVTTAEPVAPPAPPVAGQVAQQVAVLRSSPDGTHTMTVVLTPETLGPVEVQVTLSQGTVDLALKSATEAGRAALLEALPDLRRDLAGAGLTCTSASVDRDAGASWASAQQHAAGDRAGQQGQPDGRGRPWLRGAEADAGRPTPGTTATQASGVDVRI